MKYSISITRQVDLFSFFVNQNIFFPSVNVAKTIATSFRHAWLTSPATTQVFTHGIYTFIRGTFLLVIPRLTSRGILAEKSAPGSAGQNTVKALLVCHWISSKSYLSRNLTENVHIFVFFFQVNSMKLHDKAGIYNLDTLYLKGPHPLYLFQVFYHGGPTCFWHNHFLFLLVSFRSAFVFY